MVMDEFVVGFHFYLDEISKLELKYESKGRLLVRQAYLGAHDINIIIASAGENYTLQELSTSLRSG